jgi:DNA polymerase type B, organellar and viral
VFDERFFWVPTDVAEKHRRQAERRAVSKAQYETRRDKNRNHHRAPMATREFIVWDGEGPKDTGYSLLGNSEGDELCYPTLKSEDCLRFIIECARKYPDAIHVSYGFDYDVSNIIKDLPWRCIAALHKFNRTIWRGYQIEHVPHKWLRVRYGHISIRIFDVHSFFGKSLVGALEEWTIGPFADSVSPTYALASVCAPLVPPITQMVFMSEQTVVEIFKRLRSDFTWADIESIRQYMRLELKYTKILMGKLRDSLHSVGYSIRSWHGPGALANAAIRRHGIRDCFGVTPNHIADAARYAFVAGRFEGVLGGRVGKVYSADINSAYPYYCAQLPNLANGRWRQVTTYEPGRFGIYRIAYKACGRNAYRLHPLPYRDPRGNVTWPDRVTGWYWNPEAALVFDNDAVWPGEAQLLEGWVFDEHDENDRPFAWIVDYYNQRRDLKKIGDPAEKVIKLIINSIYGQLAQRTGWNKKDRTAPRNHKLEYAGWITSSCRAAVYRVGIRCGVDLVSIDTDGVYSRSPFDWLAHSKELGQWELEEYEDSVFWQSGIYALKQDGEWKKARSRGLPRATFSVENLLSAVDTLQSLKLRKTVFVGYSVALQRNVNERDNAFNTWETIDYDLTFGGKGKRLHVRGRNKEGQWVDICRGYCPGHGVHLLARRPNMEVNPTSRRHHLPWLEDERDLTEEEHARSLTAFDRVDKPYESTWSIYSADE